MLDYTHYYICYTACNKYKVIKNNWELFNDNCKRWIWKSSKLLEKNLQDDE